MADFRKWLLAFAVAALLFGLGSSTAYAQPGFTCNASASPNIVRNEGVAELMGDLILQCTGGRTTLAGKQIPNSNVQVSLNTNITSRIVQSAGSVSEALLLIDEPFPNGTQCPGPGCNGGNNLGNAQSPGVFPTQPLNQLACLANNDTNCAIISVGPGIGALGSYNGLVGGTPGAHTGNHYNVFQGFQSGLSAITWNGVPIDAPGTAGTRTIRVTNIRGNACISGAGGTFLPTQLFEQIAVNGGETIILNNPVQVVASVQQGLITTVPLPKDYQQCVSVNAELLGGSGGITDDGIDVAAEEGFAYSFKPRSYDQILNRTVEPPTTPSLQNVPGFTYRTESGFIPDPDIGANVQPGGLTIAALDGLGGNFVDPADSGVGSVGLATQGTQIQFAFTNIGAGANLFVPGELVLTAAPGNNYGGNPSGTAFLVGGGGALNQLTVTGTSAVAVYEIYYADAAVQEVIDLPVILAYISNTANNLPTPGTGKVAVNFAPLSSVATASHSAPVPRFCQPYTAQTLYNIAPCTCDLLFPFVTNQAGFDTGVAIANTSLDPFGTIPQQGTITLNYYGNTTGGGAAPPAATTNAPVPAGQELIFTLSNGGNFGIPATPGFEGYIISVANFQFCHAFAFISDVGAQKLAEGYLAIQLDLPLLNRTGVPGENEGH